MSDKSTGSFDFFMLPGEFEEWLARSISAHELHLVLRRQESYREEQDLPLALSEPITFLFRHWPPEEDALNESAGAAGGVVVAPPSQAGPSLLMGNLGYKAPRDSAAEAHALFVILKNELRKRMKAGLWGESTLNGERQFFRDVWSSEGARGWASSRGDLRQFASGRVIFRVGDPQSDP
jgi:hypothetical protein